METVLDAVVRDMGWSVSLAPGEEKLTYTDFQNILICRGITTNTRKCKELWSMISVLRLPRSGEKLARRANQSSTLIVTIPTLCKILGLHSDYYRSRMSGGEDAEMEEVFRWAGRRSRSRGSSTQSSATWDGRSRRPGRRS